MNAIRLRRRLDSHVLDLPELAPLVGKTVEIIILEEQEEAPPVEAPPAAAVPPPRDLSALDALAKVDFDLEAFERLREVSKI